MWDSPSAISSTAEIIAIWRVLPVVSSKKSDSIWLTTGTDSAGNFGLGVVEQQYPSTGRSRYGSISWTKTLDGGLTLSVSASRMITGDERQTLFYSGLSIPLGTRYRVSLQADRQNGTTGTQWQLTSLADRTQPDWGWQISSQQGKVISSMRR